MSLSFVEKIATLVKDKEPRKEIRPSPQVIQLLAEELTASRIPLPTNYLEHPELLTKALEKIVDKFSIQISQIITEYKRNHGLSRRNFLKASTAFLGITLFPNDLLDLIGHELDKAYAEEQINTDLPNKETEQTSNRLQEIFNIALENWYDPSRQHFSFKSTIWKLDGTPESPIAFNKVDGAMINEEKLVPMASSIKSLVAFYMRLCVPFSSKSDIDSQNPQTTLDRGFTQEYYQGNALSNFDQIPFPEQEKQPGEAAEAFKQLYKMLTESDNKAMGAVMKYVRPFYVKHLQWIYDHQNKPDSHIANSIQISDQEWQVIQANINDPIVMFNDFLHRILGFNNDEGITSWDTIYTPENENYDDSLKNHPAEYDFGNASNYQSNVQLRLSSVQQFTDTYQRLTQPVSAESKEQPLISFINDCICSERGGQDNFTLQFFRDFHILEQNADITEEAKKHVILKNLILNLPITDESNRVFIIGKIGLLQAGSDDVPYDLSSFIGAVRVIKKNSTTNQEEFYEIPVSFSATAFTETNIEHILLAYVKGLCEVLEIPVSYDQHLETSHLATNLEANIYNRGTRDAVVQLKFNSPAALGCYLQKNEGDPQNTVWDTCKTLSEEQPDSTVILLPQMLHGTDGYFAGYAFSKNGEFPQYLGNDEGGIIYEPSFPAYSLTCMQNIGIRCNLQESTTDNTDQNAKIDNYLQGIDSVIPGLFTIKQQPNSDNRVVFNFEIDKSLALKLFNNRQSDRVKTLFQTFSIDNAVAQLFANSPIKPEESLYQMFADHINAIGGKVSILGKTFFCRGLEFVMWSALAKDNDSGPVVGIEQQSMVFNKDSWQRVWSDLNVIYHEHDEGKFKDLFFGLTLFVQPNPNLDPIEVWMSGPQTDLQMGAAISQIFEIYPEAVVYVPDQNIRHAMPVYNSKTNEFFTLGPGMAIDTDNRLQSYFQEDSTIIRAALLGSPFFPEFFIKT